MPELTLGSIKSDDQMLHIYCDHWNANGEFCSHYEKVSLDAMIERFGPDMTLDQFKARSRCKKCGHRPCNQVTVTPNQTGGVG